MKRSCLYIILLLMATAVQAKTELTLSDLYRQIDEAIEQSPNYVADYKLKIERERQRFVSDQEAEHKLLLAEQLFWLYKPFKNDSALFYAQTCIDLADSIHLSSVSNRYRALMARQCSNAGMYMESVGILRQIDKSALDRQGLTDYYDAWMHVCGEVGAYTLLPDVRNHYFAEQDHYRDSVLMYADEGSEEYLHLLMSNLVARKEYQEALKVSDRWINMTSEGTHADAYAAYYRHIVYDKLGNKEMTRFWLGKSAVDDIKCAVMDQASLITLAELLNYDGDLERSYRYIRFTWQCNSFFNTRMRAGQISPVLNVIEKNYQDSIARNTRLLILASVMFVVLAGALLSMFWYVSRQKRKLTKAHRDLLDANEELATANEKLTRMNARVTRYNKQLFDINYELRMEKEQMQADETDTSHLAAPATDAITNHPDNVIDIN